MGCRGVGVGVEEGVQANCDTLRGDSPWAGGWVGSI